MKTTTTTTATLAAILIFSSSVQVIHAQGTFQNLDFESPILPLVPTGEFNHVSASNAVPGWTVLLGESQFDQVRYNQISIGSAAVSLLEAGNGGEILQGTYTAVLYPGLSPTISQQVPASIEQFGMVPVDARTLYFEAGRFADTGQVLATFSGESLSLVPVLITPIGAGIRERVLFGVDVSGLAGVSGTLRFTAPNVTGNANTLTLDDIHFSTEIIPEPKVLGLLALGGLLLCLRGFQKRSE